MKRTYASLVTLSSRPIAIGVLLLALGAGTCAAVGIPDDGVSGRLPPPILAAACALFASTFTGLLFLGTAGQVIGREGAFSSLVNRAVFLSIVTILSVGTILSVHFTFGGGSVQSPWHWVVDHVIAPDSTSNVWWMKTLYSGAIGSMLIMFSASLMGRRRLAAAFGLMGGLAAVGATMSLAAVFARLSSTTIWYGGGQLGLYFLCSSVVAGAAAMILFTHLCFRVRGECMKVETRKGIETAGKVLSLALYALLVVTAWRFISILAQGEGAPGRAAAEVLLRGPLAANFWFFEMGIGLVFPLILLGVTRLNSVRAMSAAALMALAGVLFDRYDMVLAGTMAADEWTHLTLSLRYLPSLGEMLWVVSGLGLMGAGLLFGERLFGPDFSSGN